MGPSSLRRQRRPGRRGRPRRGDSGPRPGRATSRRRALRRAWSTRTRTLSQWRARLDGRLPDDARERTAPQRGRERSQIITRGRDHDSRRRFSSNSFAQSVRDAIEAGKIPGPRMRAAGAVICMTGGHGWPIGRTVDSPWDTRKAVREQMWAGADCIKFIATGGVLTKGAVPGNAQLTPDELAAAVEKHRHCLRVAAADRHAGNRVALPPASTRSNTGRCSTTKRSHSSRHRHLFGTNAQRADLHPRALGRRTPTEFVLDKARGVNEVMLEQFRDALRKRRSHRGRIGCRDAVQLPRELRIRSRTDVVDARMTPQQALHAATAVAAELIGLHKGFSPLTNRPIFCCSNEMRARTARAARTP